MTDKIIDEVMHMVAELENAVYDVATTGRGASDALRLNHAIRAKLREVLERKPLTANEVHGLAESAGYWPWDASKADFINGIRYAEMHHQIGAE